MAENIKRGSYSFDLNVPEERRAWEIMNSSGMTYRKFIIKAILSYSPEQTKEILPQQLESILDRLDTLEKTVKNLEQPVKEMQSSQNIDVEADSNWNIPQMELDESESEIKPSVKAFLSAL
ncbi:hypothetical protein [Cuneatibacter caecimuris]|nr:hypothetical protein [Cuneatibacter caecimuris]